MNFSLKAILTLTSKKQPERLDKLTQLWQNLSVSSWHCSHIIAQQMYTAVLTCRRQYSGDPQEEQKGDHIQGTSFLVWNTFSPGARVLCFTHTGWGKRTAICTVGAGVWIIWPLQWNYFTYWSTYAVLLNWIYAFDTFSFFFCQLIMLCLGARLNSLLKYTSWYFPRPSLVFPHSQESFFLLLSFLFFCLILHSSLLPVWV